MTKLHLHVHYLHKKIVKIYAMNSAGKTLHSKENYKAMVNTVRQV